MELRDRLQQPETAVGRVFAIQEEIVSDPYNIRLYVVLAEEYGKRGYPDLAAGAAYKALLLADAAEDESDEYHDVVLESLQSSTGEKTSESVASGLNENGSSSTEDVVPKKFLPSM